MNNDKMNEFLENNVPEIKDEEKEEFATVKMRAETRDKFKEKAKAAGLSMQDYFDHLVAPVMMSEAVEGEEITVVPLDEIGENPMPDKFIPKTVIPEWEPYDEQPLSSDHSKIDPKTGKWITYFKEEARK